MSAADPQFKLRLPEAMHAQIAKDAERNGRSMTAEIIQRLDYRDFSTVDNAENLSWRDRLAFRLMLVLLEKTPEIDPAALAARSYAIAAAMLAARTEGGVS